jgi:tetratricopeptide (TPR) repeat protein
MSYKEIMQRITEGLTGDSKRDLVYLRAQSEAYKTHELAKEIMRGIGRLNYSVMPEDMREEFGRALNNYYLGMDVTLEEAVFQISGQKYDRALELLESVIKEIEDGHGERIFFLDDSVSEYRRFDNFLEEHIYRCLTDPQKDVRRIPEDYTNIYFRYGYLLYELQRYDEALAALKKAEAINPVRVDIQFEIAGIYKNLHDWEKFRDIAQKCLLLSYRSKDLARAYRYLGFYYVEQENYDLAVALLAFSMDFDNQVSTAPAELLYIQGQIGKPLALPEPDAALKMLAENDIQIGASDLVEGLTAAIIHLAEEHGDIAGAKMYCEVLYDITHNPSVKEKLDSLENKS